MIAIRHRAPKHGWACSAKSVGPNLLRSRFKATFENLHTMRAVGATLRWAASGCAGLHWGALGRITSFP